MRLKLYQSRKEENVKFKLKKEFDLSIEIYISFSWENQIFGLFRKTLKPLYWCFNSFERIMLNWILNIIWGDYNQKQLDKIKPLITAINHFYAELDSLSDEQIQAKTEEFRTRLQNGESLDDLLPEAFAVVKQACKRLVGTTCMVKGQEVVWNMIPYDVQLMGGIILHQGKIAEMKTGEGKTLVAVAPVYLNAISGKGVHVVTVNDYLASRDAEWMAYVYRRLGLTVGSVVKSTPLADRRNQYSADITYVENSELGFDYLRDNLVKTLGERNLTWRPLNYAIVDEIDSILIDEARTPLIISQPREEPTEKYSFYAQLVQALMPCSSKKKVSKGFIQEVLSDEYGVEHEEDGDYYIDEKTKTAQLSGKGISKLESLLKVENIYKDMGYGEIHHIENALKAKAVYIKDKDYIISNGEILIVDEHTGRTMPGRRFSEGLHQAIEAKEGVQIQRESQTMATITYQNFFKQYKKLSGMTGTASTEGEEFSKIYELEVVIVPTNRGIRRVDLNDKVYFDQKTKWKFVKEYIKFYHQMGQPILIGTADIATSEYVSRLLEREAIVHNVLNAKFHEQEANIVSRAGKYKSVVVATNMAGRGTDIKLEEGLNEKIAQNYVSYMLKVAKAWTQFTGKIYSEEEYLLIKNAFIHALDLQEGAGVLTTELQINGVSIIAKLNTKRKQNTDSYATVFVKPLDASLQKDEEEKDLFFGLFILGTEKHESRRIDNQLRGRAGRQWDPGVSVFFVALDDGLMRKMGGEKIQALAGMLLSRSDLENLELTQSQFTKSITRSQKEIEGWYFGIRKHLFDYDSVVDKQRKRVYKLRDDILEAETNEEKRKAYVESFKDEFLTEAKNIVITQINNAEMTGQSVADLLIVLNKEFGLNMTREEYEEVKNLTHEEVKALLMERFDRYFTKVFETLSEEILFDVFRGVHLHFIDKLWVDHIDDMQNLREKVGLMSYAQLDPLVMYKKESFEKFQELMKNIINSTAGYLMRLDFEAIAGEAQASTSFSENDQENVMGILAGADLPQQKTQNTDARAKIFETQDDGEFEIFEVDDTPKTSSDTKVRPNDACPCGSGKKYKKCHGAN